MFANPQEIIEQFGILPGHHIADLGSGPGIYVLAMSKLAGDSGRIFAVDVQKDFLTSLDSEAKNKSLSNILTVWGDIEKEKGSRLRDSSLDIVLIANTLFQVKHRDILLKEAFRILKENGRLILIDWTDSHGGIGPHDEQVITEEDSIVLLEQIDFKMDRKIRAGEHHYGLIFIKQL